MKYFTFIFFTFLISCGNGKTKLVVKNLDSVDIDSVHIKVTGNEYFLQKIKKNNSEKIDLFVTGESHIKIYFGNDTAFHYVDVYLEPYSGGLVEVGIFKDSLSYFFHNP